MKRDHLSQSELQSTANAANQASALEEIVASLEEDIVFGRLHPRERLIEDELMERYRAKRHVVREALALLDHMGLIERRKNIGALVCTFTPEKVEELYEMRGLLESEAARLIPLPAPKEAIEHLESVQREHDEAAKKGDKRRLFRTNQLFHETLFAMTGNTTLQAAIQEYARQTHAIRFMTLKLPAYVEQARLEHWQIIEALRHGDRNSLTRLCKTHLQPARKAYREGA